MKLHKRAILSALLTLTALAHAVAQRPVEYVRPMMGTTNNGYVAPVAAAPFGMVELCPDTFFSGSGYLYEHGHIYGFSHTHKSGMGGTDFQDIMFLPVADASWSESEECPERLSSRFSHDKEYVEPGYYRVTLLDYDIEAELTAQEADIARRGRNAQAKHAAPKNADPADYAHATGLEALWGYLYLSGETQRLDTLIKLALTRTDDIWHKQSSK